MAVPGWKRATLFLHDRTVAINEGSINAAFKLSGQSRSAID